MERYTLSLMVTSCSVGNTQQRGDQVSRISRWETKQATGKVAVDLAVPPELENALCFKHSPVPFAWISSAVSSETKHVKVYFERGIKFGETAYLVPAVLYLPYLADRPVILRLCAEGMVLHTLYSTFAVGPFSPSMHDTCTATSSPPDLSPCTQPEATAFTATRARASASSNCCTKSASAWRCCRTRTHE